ncbi:MAG: universal stress protein [Rhodoferax sp.]|nr:universal stress protein [Rhodoferax sp.]
MYKKILVVVDEREVSQSAIGQGIALARVHRADLLFFYVLPRYVFPSVDMVPVAEVTPDDFQRDSSQHASQRLAAASALAERAGVHSHRAMGSGPDDAHCVAEAATQRHCDLIVVATEEKNAVIRLLTGSIIPGLISAATVPLLICRAKTVRAPSPRLRVGHKPRT